ncbi:TetR/AcrR family transcriptional regulator [Actinomadura montaniterrae]|uniref:TetR/AcrR family transcriptional regulator n=1 Tax=Actinomadura montaniterrae TaxID=1803903 RepID=A0A6L3VKL2_9ACTN|nr:TetR/AcrR family transcriptional regulator [Actinomadura montaniterrae]KAB2371915.1 TetR/AcrR family transcriptional regulator [Actinomadura montaniterrae]
MSSQVTSPALRQGLNARQAETVENLMAAGLEELRAVGHEALTIRTVAQRAGVSPATAYTYLSSKNHLFAELFWRHLSEDGGAAPAGASATERLQATVRALTARIVVEPELAAAVTPALLGSDPDVARLRLRIGGEFYARFEAALAAERRPGGPGGMAGPAGSGGTAGAGVLEVLVLTFTGALLQAGMGLLTYDQIADRLVAAVEVIMRGNE